MKEIEIYVRRVVDLQIGRDEHGEETGEVVITCEFSDGQAMVLESMMRGSSFDFRMEPNLTMGAQFVFPRKAPVITDVELPGGQNH